MIIAERSEKHRYHLGESNLSRFDQSEMCQCFSGRFQEVADGLDTGDEEAKLGIQIRGIFSELQLSDLKKKTLRGQMGFFPIIAGLRKHAQSRP